MPGGHCPGMTGSSGTSSSGTSSSAS
jgi:hypothetical protein